ncbi:cyanophycinase-like isoform X2 [Ptychodera flava]
MFVNEYGAASTYYVPITVNTTDKNSDPDVVDSIQQQTGFFFGDGEQTRIIESWFLSGRVESPALIALKDTYAAGAVIGGTGAGTTCLSSTVMVTGGLSWSGLVYGSCNCTSHPDDPNDGLTYDPDGGLGVIDDVVLDTHFSESGREGRLIRLLADTMGLSRGAEVGVGVDENTAFVVYDIGTSSQRGTVLGENGVFFADMDHAHIHFNPFDIEHVDCHYLTEKDEYNFLRDEVTYASYKKNLIGDEMNPNAETSSDVFSNPTRQPRQYGEFRRVAVNLLDSRDDSHTCGRSYMSGPYYYVDFTQIEKSSAAYGNHPNYGHRLISYEDIHIDIDQSSHPNCGL